MTVTITRVAILFDGIVYSLPKPYRHHHILNLLRHERSATRWNLKQKHVSQGFVTSEGEYVDRLYALDIFAKAKQEFVDTYIYPSGLYSENCWSTPGKWYGEPGSPERELYEYNENPDVIESLLRLEKFTGSVKPYRIEILLADFFHIEGVALKIKDHRIDENLKLSSVLYSDLYKEPMDGDMCVNDLKVRIATWTSNWTNAD